MRAGGVPVREVEAEGCRLTGGFHLSEDQIAVSTLRAFPGPTSRVSELVRDRGVFRGPIFKRIYVEDPALGEPYVSARDLVMADVRPSSFLSRRLGGLIDDLRLKAGMILVTCSGMNLGSAIWTREDLDGLVASHDLIRICPNPAAVPPGYLYAFLASRYGRALIRKQIYGGSIKHVEPQHIAALVVPRFGGDVEGRVHELVTKADSMRAVSSSQLKSAAALIECLLGTAPEHGRRTSVSVSSSVIQRRFNAYYYSRTCTSARLRFDQASVLEHLLLSEVADVFIPGIFKRKYAEGPEFGRPYITGGDVFELNPASNQYLLKRVVQEYALEVTDGTILIQEAGQLGGLIGRSVFVGRHLDGFAVSNNMVRVTARDRADAGYLYALLSSPDGVTLIARESAGSSIPHMDVGRVRNIRIPWAPPSLRAQIGEIIETAVRFRDDACADEAEARALVEHAIEAAT